MTAHLRFPAFPLRSAEDFQRFAAENRALLDERLRQEMLFIREGQLVRAGTCGACLAVTHFTSDTATSHGAYDPGQQICDCAARLSAHRRALLHLAGASFGGRDWFRLGLFGQDAPLALKLATLCPPAWVWPKTQAKPAATHMVLSVDTLSTVPDPGTALAWIAESLMPGGLFLFTLPFDPAARDKQPPLAGSPRRFGWDILDRVRDAGFQDCVAHCYWSGELGLLGPDAMIFKAFR
ncbi:methyltransferase domain-containing protein [Acidisoma silvae]|uniref:Uncharacterized protein n=1 Tax=Acidisoma silvae TaxID=2802396 RepID=A0A963YMU9_9PROT|nr:hypothetical protein [Acidisoma silvae]MCB8873619.1 hypothetical protein [Acidisoma silvae]